MKYYEEVILKNGKKCCLRNGEPDDGKAVYENFNQTHEETDFLLSYPDENSLDPDQEAEYLEKKLKNPREVEIVAFIDGNVVGTAGIDAIGNLYKVKHRAEFGISILKDYWGMGIGQILLDACIKCAREADYQQIELDVIADNTRAIALYKKAGFTEFGRNPMGFCSRTKGFQELVYMRLEL